MDFNTMPAEVKARLLAQHLKYYMQLVDDLTDDLKLINDRLQNKKLENQTLRATIKEQERQIIRYGIFIQAHGLQKAASGYGLDFETENKAA